MRVKCMGHLGQSTRNTKNQCNKSVPSSKVSHCGVRGPVVCAVCLHVHGRMSAHVCLRRGCSTSHVIAVSGLQWQHQARCVDVPGYLEPNPPARLLTAAPLAALTCQSYTAQLTLTITSELTFWAFGSASSCCFITLHPWFSSNNNCTASQTISG